MTRRPSSLLSPLILTGGLLLAACGAESPEKLLASAKGYLAKDNRPAAVIELKTLLQTSPEHAEARFLLGKSLFDSEDFAGAAIELRKAAQLGFSPDTVAPLLAKALLDSGQPEKVVELDGRWPMTDPQAIAGFKTRLAMAHAGLDHSEQANAAIAEALKAQPNYGPALLYQARALGEKGQLDQALKLVEQVLASSPESAEALVAKGDLLQARTVDSDAPLSLYRKALRAKPTDVYAFVALMEQLLARNDVAAAKEELEGVRKVRPRRLPSVIYFEARIAAQKREWQNAEELSQELLTAVPDDPHYLQLAGVVALARGQTLIAQERLAKLVQKAPNAVAPRQLLAYAFLRGGDPAKALDALEPLLSADTPRAFTYSIAAGAALSLGNIKQAEDLYSRAAKLEPDDSHNRAGAAVAKLFGGNLGGVSELEAIARSDAGTSSDMALVTFQISRRQYDAALKAIERLESKPSGKALAPVLRARVYGLQGDYVAARAGYERALAVDPTYYAAIEGLAMLDLRDGKADAARSRFEQVLKRSPDDARALIGLATLNERMGASKDDVVKLLVKAVRLKPADAFARRQLVQYLLIKGDFKAALNEAREAVAAAPDDGPLLAMLAQAQFSAGDFGQAASSYGRLVAKQPKAVAPLLGLAEANLAAGSYASATEAIRKAEALAPDAPDLIAVATRADIIGKQPAQAIARARAFQTRQPKSAIGFSAEAEVEASRRNWSGAVSAYQAALQREPDASGVAQRLYLAMRAGGDAAKAESFGESWYQAHPTDGAFPFFVARVAIGDKRYEAAESWLQRLSRAEPDNPFVANNLAWVLSALKKPGALELAERADRLAPNQPLFMDTLAGILAEQGQLQRATQLQKKAVELEPDSPQLRLGLARLYIRAGDRQTARQELEPLAKLGDKFPQHGEVADLLAKL